MYLLAKFDDRRSYKNGDINSYIKSYKNTLQKAELTASIRHIAIFLKPVKPIYNSDFPDKRRRRRTQAIPKRYAFMQTQKVVHCISNKKKKINDKFLSHKHSHKKNYNEKRDFHNLYLSEYV